MTAASRIDLIARLRYLDDYAKANKDDLTVFRQSADTIELLERALTAAEKALRELNKENEQLRKYIAEGAPQK